MKMYSKPRNNSCLFFYIMQSVSCIPSVTSKPSNDTATSLLIVMIEIYPHKVAAFGTDIPRSHSVFPKQNNLRKLHTHKHTFLSLYHPRCLALHVHVDLQLEANNTLPADGPDNLVWGFIAAQLLVQTVWKQSCASAQWRRDPEKQ